MVLAYVHYSTVNRVLALFYFGLRPEVRAMNGILKKSDFGETNNYTESYVRRDLINSELAEDLKKEFGDKLVPISLDLTSLDGFKDYGSVEGDILAIPNIQLGIVGK